MGPMKDGCEAAAACKCVLSMSTSEADRDSSSLAQSRSIDIFVCSVFRSKQAENERDDRVSELKREPRHPLSHATDAPATQAFIQPLPHSRIQSSHIRTTVRTQGDTQDAPCRRLIAGTPFSLEVQPRWGYGTIKHTRHTKASRPRAIRTKAFPSLSLCSDAFMKQLKGIRGHTFRTMIYLDGWMDIAISSPVPA